MTNFKSFYAQIASVYEPINHIVTFGLDRLWRRTAAITASSLPGKIWIDACTGTGETAIGIAARSVPPKRVIAIDFSLAMLQQCSKNNISHHIQIVASDCADLPFRMNSVDGISITFAVRNLSHSPGGLNRYFAECLRILKPGGHLLLLETSQPKQLTVRLLFHWFLTLSIVPLSRIISPVTSPYRYLAASIKQFHDGNSLKILIEECGFERVNFRYMTFGAVAIHLATKPARSDVVNHPREQD